MTASLGPPPTTVAVIGSGFSGLLTALHLLEAYPAIRVRVVEKAPQFGRGRAYASPNPDHVLNVRSANMSAFPERPRHFQDWLRANGANADPDAFATRRQYGDYLQSLLRRAMRRDGAAGRLLLEKDEVVDVVPGGDGYEVRLALGRRFPAAAVVLAVGAGQPDRLPQIDPDVLGRRTYVGDPWRTNLRELPAGEILLLGTGLTMVDVALTLDRPGRRLLAVSRHGQVPRTHDVALPAPPPAGSLSTPREALRTLREHAAEVGWRSAVDSIRGQTPEIWRGWSLDERRRFLRHVQPHWDAHRHRVDPQIGLRLLQAIWGERLAILAGRVLSVTGLEEGLAVEIRLRGRHLGVKRRYAAVVNCAGLSGEIASVPLLARLAERGLVRQDALRLGLDVDDRQRAFGAGGALTPGLFAIGPMTRAASWEALAVPDLRAQAVALARHVAAWSLLHV